MYSTLFAVNRPLSESLQSPTHIECSSGFLSQETRTDTFSSSHVRSPNSSSLFQFFCEGSFLSSLFWGGGGRGEGEGGGGQSSKRLSGNRLRCEHRRFYMVTSVGLVSCILADLGPSGELLTKQTSFLCAACENRITKLR